MTLFWTALMFSCIFLHIFAVLAAVTDARISRRKRVVWIGVKYQKVIRSTTTTTSSYDDGFYETTTDEIPTVTFMAESEPPTPTTSTPHLCSADFIPDVIAQTADGNTYVFAATDTVPPIGYRVATVDVTNCDVYWQIMDFAGNVVDNRQNAGHLISQDWPTLPGKLDAGLTLSDGTSLFFKDDKFHIFWNKMPREPTTAPISVAFPQIPTEKIEGAFVTNTSLIFFQGENFYVYGIEQFPFVQRGNVIDMGLPMLSVESAVNLSDGLAYVIMDKTVYQIDTLTLQVVSSFPTQSLYGCLEPMMANRRMVLFPYGRKFDLENSSKDTRPLSNSLLYHLNLI